MAFTRLMMLRSSKRSSSSSATAFFCRHLSSSDVSSSASLLSALVRPITVRTGVGLYPSLVRANPQLYAAAKDNTEGLDLTVDYLDTATWARHPHRDSPSSSSSPSSSKNPPQKTILAIPGTGGHYGNYSGLVEHFRRHRPEVRLLAPNLPDFGHTRNGGRIFWHSNAELVAFLRDFLAALDVRTVDVALAHSMAIHRLLGLCAEPGPTLTIKSAAFFGAQPLYDLNPRHAALTRKLFFTFRSEAFYNFLNAIRLHRLPLIPVHYPHLNDALLFAVQSLDAPRAQADLPRLLEHLVEVSTEKSIPLTLLYGSKEKFISRRAMDRLFAACGLTDPAREVLLVDPEVDRKEVIVDAYGAASEQPRVKGIILKGGGHFAFANYPAFTAAVVEDLLKRSESVH